MHLNLLACHFTRISVAIALLLVAACNGGKEYSDKNPSALRQYVTEPKKKAEDVKDKIEKQQKDTEQQLKDLSTY